jgi:three-Cys-motif partner protein
MEEVMKKAQSFGGDWTEDKLDRLTAYLAAYMQAMKNQPYRKIYVDAFASTGYRATGSKKSPQQQLLMELGEPEAQGFLKGSASRALDIQPGFDEYLFIEKDRKRSRELEKLRTDHIDLADKIQIVTADANDYLKQWCDTMDWSRNRAVLFLDPFGMQVEWSLLEVIAKTKAIDVWLLFPFVGLNRHLTIGEPPPEEWAARITKTMGNEEWKNEFYPAKTEPTLFEDAEIQSKDTDFDRIGAYFVKRLETIFPGVAKNPLPMRNSNNTPLFLFCFAVSNPRGKDLALRLAEHILNLKKR